MRYFERRAYRRYRRLAILIHSHLCDYDEYCNYEEVCASDDPKLEDNSCQGAVDAENIAADIVRNGWCR